MLFFAQCFAANGKLGLFLLQGVLHHLAKLTGGTLIEVGAESMGDITLEHVATHPLAARQRLELLYGFGDLWGFLERIALGCYMPSIS